MPDASGDGEYDADVAIVGAGPGGATLAYLLARSGADVCLLERERDLERSFRGYLFQPFVLWTFDRMGILDAVLSLDHHAVRSPSLELFGKRTTPFDFGRYPAPYDRAVLMEQPPLLRLLVDRADRYDGFDYRDATTVTDLVASDGGVTGVRGTDRTAGEDVEVRSRVVVGADGRYSTVRAAAGVDPGRLNSRIELVWFKLPADAVAGESLARIDEAGALLYFGLGEDEAQLGYPIEAGEYATLRSAGIEALRERVTAVDPSLAEPLGEHLTDVGDTSRLRIEPGLSERWIDDGIVLLGDAAHIASPVGGQGNGLAIADAVVAHSVITDALASADGPLPAAALRPYAEIRRPTVRRILRLQRRGERAVSAFVRHHDRVPGVAVRAVVRGLAALAFGTPLGCRLGDQFAWGSREPVDVGKFVDVEAE